ncbi:MAG TPA: glycosyltransferase, partial [Candidatus Limnocylindria bacterium]|nr:glycosyltransferase [Candidatus Limnocylindria bacterium]
MLLVSGDIERRTGGNLYDLRMVRACRRAGVPLRMLTVRSSPQARAVLKRDRPRVVIVDSIAIPIAAPLVRWMRSELRARVVVLMHMGTAGRGTRTLLRSADRVIAASVSLERMLVSGGVPRQRITVIPPGRDRVPRVAKRKRRGERVRVLTVANWSPSKGIATLVAAAAHVSELRLDLVGDTGAPA